MISYKPSCAGSIAYGWWHFISDTAAVLREALSLVVRVSCIRLSHIACW